MYDHPSQVGFGVIKKLPNNLKMHDAPSQVRFAKIKRLSNNLRMHVCPSREQITKNRSPPPTVLHIFTFHRLILFIFNTYNRKGGAISLSLSYQHF